MIMTLLLGPIALVIGIILALVVLGHLVVALFEGVWKIFKRCIGTR